MGDYLWYDRGHVLTPAGRVLDTVECLEEALVRYPWPIVFRLGQPRR